MLLAAVTAVGTPASPSPRGLTALPLGSALLSFPGAAEGQGANPGQQVMALKLRAGHLRGFCLSIPCPAPEPGCRERSRGEAPAEMQFSFAPVRNGARALLEPGLCCKALLVHGIQSQGRAGASPQPGAKGEGSRRGSPPQPGRAASAAPLGWASHPCSLISAHSPTRFPKKVFPRNQTRSRNVTAPFLLAYKPQPCQSSLSGH